LYSLKTEKDVDKIFLKLKKRDSKQLEAINKKVKQILENPYQFKSLRFPMQHLRRVHIGSFVLIHEIIENGKTIRILHYKHHDKA
jgi:mRNA-degrading endonuclease RelE of RelBE toxin-antitoxin system